MNYSLLDALIDNQVSFAIYRLPNQSQPVFMLQQQSATPELTDLSQLNGVSGFVIAPFKINQHHALTYIQPDISAQGETAILQLLQQLPYKLTGHVDASACLHRAKQHDFAHYQQVFNTFLSALERQQFEKLVLSRSFSCAKSTLFSAGATFKQACQRYPNAFVYLCHTKQSGTWLGCTPELMLSGEQGQWQTVALAGTQRWQAEGVLWDDKNKQEQQIVAAYIRQQLHQCGLAFRERGPYSIKAGTLTHLKSEFTFNLTHHHLGDLLKRLHPTPAVCGLPKQAAYDFLLQHEGYDRAYYAGFIGHLNPEAKTDLYVNLRCMHIESDHLTLFAGGGLLPSSDLMAEWRETEEKLQTMLALIECGDCQL